MKTKAVRIHGKNDIRLDTFDLPEPKDDEILAHIVSNSICMSSHKAAEQGPDHKRVPNDVAENPTILGHEFSGELIKVGSKWKSKFKENARFSIQPALNYKGSLDAPGYSFRTIGGNATYIVIPNEVMECNCLLEYKGEGYFPASLSEPMSCIVGAYHASYHTTSGSYVHHMGIKEGGNLALLAAAGPMGLGAIDYAIHCDPKPGRLVVTDIDQARLNRAEEIYSVEEAKRNGVELIYVDTSGIKDPESHLISLTGGEAYNDVFVFAPIKVVVDMGDRLLARDGCLNFFAGPTTTEFKAELNFYNVHYGSTHIVGTSGGNTDDMIESLDLMARRVIDPAVMVTHVGGLSCVVNTVMDLPKIPGGKKLIYTNIEMDLTAIADFAEKGKSAPMFAKLAELCRANNGLWSLEAEAYLLQNAKRIE